MKIGFAGLSHLGLIYSQASAAVVGETLAYAPDATLIAQLQAGRFPLEEPGFTELRATHASKIRYTAGAKDLADCALVFFALDVTTDEQNQSNPAPLRQLIETVFPVLPVTAVVVILSQVSPGFMRELKQRYPERACYYQVETLVFGQAVERALCPERYMIGADDPAQPLPAVYEQWLSAFPCPPLVMRYESAELTKIAINLFLAASVSTTNTIAELCEKIGADWNEIAPALRLDARIGPKAYVKTGLGLAGGNLERDLATFQRLANQVGSDWRIIQAFQEQSAYRRDWVVRQLQNIYDAGGVARLGIWGLAYKEDTHSIKNSVGLEVAQIFSHLSLKAYDPAADLSLVKLENCQRMNDKWLACVEADVLLIMTPWAEFKGVDLVKLQETMAGRILIDPYGMLDEAKARALGFDYARLGAD